MTISRTLRRGAVAAALAAGFVVATPMLASAHVGVSPDAVPAGTSAVLTFSFTHGCESSPTTALRIEMPEGLASVSPTVDANWDIAVERGENGLVSAVTYTAVDAVPGELRGAVSMAVRVAEDAVDPLAFPVTQQCADGANEWVELAAEGEDPHDLDAPAPLVTVQAALADEHGDGGHGGDGGDGLDDADPAPAVEAASADPLPIVLGGGGLLAGVAALIVSVLAYRRTA